MYNIKFLHLEEIKRRFFHRLTLYEILASRTTNDRRRKKFNYYCFTLGKLYYICIVDKNQKHRKIVFFKSYFQDFFDQQSKKVKAKIVWTFDLVEALQRVPETYLKL